MGQTHPCCISEVATSGGEGGEREEGSVGAECGERGEEEYTNMRVIGLPSVNLDLVQDLDSVSSLEQYYQTTIMARMPALFQSHSGDNLIAGPIYAHSESGKPFPQKESRIVYFESADPDKPCMQVAMTSEAEDKVLSYSWDRLNFVHFVNSDVTHTLGSSVYTFQICTPAISGTYGLIATKKKTLIFGKLLDGESPDDYFTKFQMITDSSTNTITTTIQGATFGMYVDVDSKDGWKVKLTKTSGLWDKFTFQKFKQDPR